MNPKELARKAKAFCVWREGNSVNWDCTADELAEATGIPRSTVQKICRARGWPIQFSGHTDEGRIRRAEASHRKNGGAYLSAVEADAPQVLNSTLNAIYAREEPYVELTPT